MRLTWTNRFTPDAARRSNILLEYHMEGEVLDRPDLQARLDAMDALYAREFSVVDGMNQDGAAHTIPDGTRDTAGSLTDSVPVGQCESTGTRSQFDNQMEQRLDESWVYRRTAHRTETLSFCDSSARRTSLTALSGISMTDISVLSVIGLPVVVEELACGTWYE